VLAIEHHVYPGCGRAELRRDDQGEVIVMRAGHPGKDENWAQLCPGAIGERKTREDDVAANRHGQAPGAG
jgi:hypothetical protein